MPFGQPHRTAHNTAGLHQGGSSLARFSGPANKVPVSLPRIDHDSVSLEPVRPYAHAYVTGIDIAPTGVTHHRSSRYNHGHSRNTSGRQSYQSSTYASRYGSSKEDTSTTVDVSIASPVSQRHRLSRPRGRITGPARAQTSAPSPYRAIDHEEPSAVVTTPRRPASLPPLSQRATASSSRKHIGSITHTHASPDDADFAPQGYGSNLKRYSAVQGRPGQEQGRSSRGSHRRTRSNTSTQGPDGHKIIVPRVSENTPAARSRAIRVEGKVLKQQREMLTKLFNSGQLNMAIFDVSRLGDLWSQFTRISRLNKRDGFIDRVEFDYLLQPFGLNDSPFAHRLFSVWDKDNNGVIDVGEFLVGMSAFMDGTYDQKINFAFKVFDLDASGYLTMDEIYNAFWSALPKEEMDAIEQHIRATFAQVDANDDGQISLDEFQEFAKRDTRLVNLLFPHFSHANPSGTGRGTGAAKEGNEREVKDETGDKKKSSKHGATS